MEELSAVLFLERMLTDALSRQVTDVHLHDQGDRILVHFRVSGKIEVYASSSEAGRSVIRRIKALARMDIAETRLPQDGSFFWESETQQCDIRVASVPTVNGESVVLRLLTAQRGPLSFTAIGMTPLQAESMNELLKNHTGLILVAGPTGSGKTTTLYAMMLQLSRWGRHVVSIEDPVEMPVDYCRQVEVREQVGVTFDIGLRALLRQDPDVIMIGEIRDQESAKVALRAALSGHLVLSTTHARDLVGAAARIVEFGLPRSMVGDVLKAVVVQRLISMPCERCERGDCTDCQNHSESLERTAVFQIHEMAQSMVPLFSSPISWGELRERIEQLEKLT